MEGEKGYKKGLWTVEEDEVLMEYVRVHGKGRWSRVAKITGLKRCGKSCRLRWMNYLSPSIKHGDFSEEEDDLIIRLHNLLGNRWSLIAGRVPGRTDNQVKNHWNTHLSKKLGIRKGRAEAGRSSRTPSQLENSTSFPYLSLSGREAAPMDASNLNLKLDGSKDNSIGADDQKKGIQFSSGNEVKSIVGVEETVTAANEHSDSPYWISNLETPSLMEFLNQYSPDFVWHGL